MGISNVSKTAIRKAIEMAVNSYSLDENFEVFTDFHLHVDSDAGELSVSDDDDLTLASVIVEEWVDVDGDDEMAEVAHYLSMSLHEMADDHCFDKVCVAKPFSFVLIDDDQETIEELYIVDDDMIIISDELLKGVDKELDEFFDQLMKED